MIRICFTIVLLPLSPAPEGWESIVKENLCSFYTETSKTLLETTTVKWLVSIVYINPQDTFSKAKREEHTTGRNETSKVFTDFTNTFVIA